GGTARAGAARRGGARAPRPRAVPARPRRHGPGAAGGRPARCGTRPGRSLAAGAGPDVHGPGTTVLVVLPSPVDRAAPAVPWRRTLHLVQPLQTTLAGLCLLPAVPSRSTQ